MELKNKEGSSVPCKEIKCWQEGEKMRVIATLIDGKIIDDCFDAETARHFYIPRS